MSEEKNLTSYSDSYKAAGVDVTAGYESVELMKKHVKRTVIPGVVSGIGGFGGLFAPDLTGMEEPVLVSGTDGVGTKLKIAMLLDKHDTIGIDAVAMCVNDVVCCGAKPLFFLDYIACGKNYPEKIAAIVAGVAEGCVQSGCALIGGETAEHPGHDARRRLRPGGLYRRYRGQEEDCGRLPPSGRGRAHRRQVLRRALQRVLPGAEGVRHRRGRQEEQGDREHLLRRAGRHPGGGPAHPHPHLRKAPAGRHGEGGHQGRVPHHRGRVLREHPPHDEGGPYRQGGEGQGAGAAHFRAASRRPGTSPSGICINTFNMGIGLCVAVSKDTAQAAVEAFQAAGEEAVLLGEVVEGSEGVVLW